MPERPSFEERGERRVVVTGMGAITPIGNDVASFWDSLVAGRSGIRRIDRFDPARLAQGVVKVDEQPLAPCRERIQDDERRVRAPDADKVDARGPGGAGSAA
jgi:3-oxoacyl-(acyl-carrier-protein) synthase